MDYEMQMADISKLLNTLAKRIVALEEEVGQLKGTTTNDTFKVELTYFKDTGKYYTEGHLRVPTTISRQFGGLPRGSVYPLWEVSNIVRYLSTVLMLPGLATNHSAFTVLVNVPGHPHECPHLVLPGRFPTVSRDSLLEFEVPDDQ